MVHVGVVGAGYVGLTTAACLASLGHDVVCADIDEARVERLRRGDVPFHEPGLAALLSKALASGRLRFVLGAAAAAENRQVVFLCVATPQGDDGNHDLTFIDAATDDIAQALAPNTVVVTKSTVPIGTAQRITQRLGRGDVYVAANPEFLAEGTAVSDFMSPSRIIVGSENRDAAWLVASLYGHISAPVVVTDSASAELIKLASNAFLATKLSFVNTVSAVCEQIGANVNDVAGAMGLDPRIGSRYLHAGPGWGGSCLPKDTRALVHAAAQVGVDFGVVAAAISANDTQLQRIADKIIAAAAGGTVGVWGLTFKANTDDLRDSPSLTIVDRVLASGAAVTAFDPAISAAHPLIPHQVQIVGSALTAATGASCLAVLTEWDDFRWIPPAEVAAVMDGRTVVDGRDLLNAADWSAAGFTVRGIGS
ncbi:MAG: UDP-glucose/GDP-mannose dehydrogenase family protein [Ilumatobacteraceae bacterium]